MANIKSAKKRIKVIAKKTAINNVRRSQMKTAIRRFEEALTAGNMEEAKATFQSAQKKISKIAASGTIHKNAAARKVSRLSKKLNAAMNA
ncbi:30S ribosomal protein S20 [Peptostreptococcaceae bacterium AGR-M142]